MNEPLVSIIIPTRNRQLYALNTVRQIVELNRDIEIIVYDNSDKDTLYKDLLELIQQKKVKYGYEKKVLPFSENYNRAAEEATGRYLCAIGDDDGILPNIIECAKWMETNNIDAVKPAKDQVYFYPGNKNKKKNACLGIGTYDSAFYFANPESAMISLLDDGGCNYLEKNLPGSYHGLVRMSLMNEVKRITGKYYSGLTPDMYSVSCLSLLPGIHFAVINYPISLPGVCPLSGSALSDSGKHIGRLEESPHLKAFPQYKWSDYVPKFYSVETIWAETMIFAITKMGREELIQKYYNPDRLIIHMLQNNKKQQSEILNTLPPETRAKVLGYCGDDVSNKNTKIATLLSNLSVKVSGQRQVVRHIKDIREAVDTFNGIIEKRNEKGPWNIE